MLLRNTYDLLYEMEAPSLERDAVSRNRSELQIMSSLDFPKISVTTVEQDEHWNLESIMVNVS